MTAQRIRILLAAIVAAVIICLIIVLYLYTSSLKPYKPVAQYSERYAAAILSMSANSGAYYERDYSVASTNERTTPLHGELIVNPIQVQNDEEEVPQIQSSSYNIESDGTSPLHTRIINSKRSKERSGPTPEAAIFSLEYSSSDKNETWEALTLYNTAQREDLVDSALIFAPSSTEHETTWQGNVSLYLMDGALTNHAAALLPGIDILNEFSDDLRATGVLYTNRPLAIGSLPSTLQDKSAVQALEAAHSAKTLENVENLRMNTSQRITGTDLLFDASEGKTARSTIQAAVSTGTAQNSFTLEGGVIAVGEGATLVVGSGDIGTANAASESTAATSIRKNTVSAGSINLTPRAIIVDGGTLVVSVHGVKRFFSKDQLCRSLCRCS